MLPNNESDMSPPLHPGSHFELVTFEPKHQIKLSYSTNKATLFVNFALYLESFEKFHEYSYLFERDMNNPSQIGSLVLLPDICKMLLQIKWKQTDHLLKAFMSATLFAID